jgi:hypothetical protein
MALKLSQLLAAISFRTSQSGGETKVTNHVAEVADKLRRRLVITGRTLLSRRDVALVCDVLALRGALLDDLLPSGSSTTKVVRNWERTILGLKTLDVELYSSDWATCREIITSREFLENIEDPAASHAAFKRLCEGRIHYKWVKSTTLWMIGGSDWFQRLNQWVVFDSKLNLLSLDLTTACCTDYLAFEEDYHYQTPRDINVLRRVAKDMFGDFCLTDYPFRPRHGNGASVEVRRAVSAPWTKNRRCAYDGDIVTYLRYRCPGTDWRRLLFTPYKGLDRCCQLVCVPKSTTKNRTISKEPTTLQYLQQDIRTALDDYFCSHPRLQIDLHDQAASRVLAVEGSATGSFATIDLSNASDSVSAALVEDFFDGLPILYPLMATRSVYCDVKSNDGSVSKRIRMKKFAPMGSSTCFPVETMVFTIICEAAVRLTTGQRSGRMNYRVYGDDIVVRSEYAAKVVYLLESCGFTVNTAKSFGVDPESNHRFREACGVEALDGVDITPLRLSRRLVSLSDNDSDRQAGLGVGMVDLYNRLYLHKFWTSRRALTYWLGQHWWYKSLLRVSISAHREASRAVEAGKPVPIRLASPYVITDDATDTQFRCRGVRFSHELQTRQYCVTVATQRRRGSHHDANDLHTWFVQAEARDGQITPYLAPSYDRPRDLKWSKSWVCS